jgi:hypothetical protein
MWSNILVPDRSQTTISRMRIACWYQGFKYALIICNTYCFSTSSIVARTRLNVSSYIWAQLSVLLFPSGVLNFLPFVYISIWVFWLYWVKSRNYEFHHCVLFSVLIFLSLLVHILSPEVSSQTWRNNSLTIWKFQEKRDHLCGKL